MDWFGFDKNLQSARTRSLAQNCRGPIALLEVRRLLTESNALVDGTALYGRPLINAVECCEPESLEVARLLLDRGADVDLIGAEGKTALYVACKQFKGGYGRRVLPLVELLLSRGADPRRWHNGRTLFGVALEARNYGAARLLLAHGVSVEDPVSHYGPVPIRPLFRFCESDGHESSTSQNNGGIEQVRFLLAHGAAFDFINYDGHSALTFVRSGHRRLPNGQWRGGRPEMNALFDAFLTHYWTLRVRLRLFGRRASHRPGPHRLVLGDAYLPNHIGSFVVGDGIIVKKK